MNCVSNWYNNAKDYVSEFFCNGPGMIRIPFCEGSGERWTNYYGWLPKSIWDGDIRQVGLLDLMSKAGMSLGWRRDAYCFPHSVRLLDTVLDRSGHLATESHDKRKVAPRKKRNK
jgi:hypothetical protein